MLARAMTKMLQRIRAMMQSESENGKNTTATCESRPMIYRINAPLAWGNKVNDQFRWRVLKLCDNLGWNPETHASWLMACMAFETGRTFSPSVRNPSSSATGLIQFMAATARGLGTTTAKLSQMTAVQQLDYVERYFRPYAHRIRSLEDTYLAILWPRGVGQSLEYILWKTGTRAYWVNRGLDRNRDGKVTKREAAAKVQAMLQEGLRPENVYHFR